MNSYKECNNRSWQIVSSNLEDANRAYWLNVRDNALLYGENIKAYNDYISFIAYLVKTMSMPNNAISSSIVLRLLTNKGIFSKNRKINYVSEISDDIQGFLGMNVILGKVCCRHVANFQNDVLAKNYLISQPFNCYMADEDIDNTDDLLPNHVINLVNYNDIYYGYDATNDKLFKFIDEFKMQELFTDQPSYILYAPHSDMIINKSTKEKAKDRIRLLH